MDEAIRYRGRTFAAHEINQIRVEHNHGAPITTTYNYDPLGQITDVWDHKQNHTTVEYDDLGRRTAINNPDTGRTEYRHDANGNLTSKLTANYQLGKEITYQYVFNRLKTIKYPNTVPVQYEYGAMNEAYNRAGRIKRVNDESGEEVRYYGKLGETTREEKTVEAKTPAVQKKKFSTDYVFDSFGRMVEMTYPDGEKLHYSYDNGGLLNAAWGEKASNRYDYVKSLTYDEFNQRKRIEYGNGTVTTYDYDQLTRNLSTLVTALKDSRKIQNLSYQYDLVGNVLNIKNSIEIPTNTALPAGPVEQNFRYDDLYRLEHGDGQYTFGPGKGNTYTSDFIYDTIGNFVTKKQVHTILQPSMSAHLPKETNYVLDYKYTGSHPHAVTDAGDKLYAYDAAGNMTGWTHKQNGTRRVITWNEENRVKQIDDNGKSTYFLYDDAGERVVKRGQHGESIYVNRFFSIRNGELGTKHVFAGETRVLSKLVKTPPTNTANSTTTSTLTSGTTTTIPGINGLDNGRGKKLGIIKRLPDGTQTGVNPPVEKDEFFYHGDHLGSSSMITDAYGAVYQHLEYFPYGETWIEEGGSYGGNTPGYKFTGKELDPETGLYYYGARYYDPVLSTWLSPDPALSKYLDRVNGDGIRHSVLHPITLALYSYAGLNPVKYVDPSGEELAYVVFSDPHVFTSTESHPMWDTKIVSNVINVVAAAKQQGIPLKITSGYRTSAYQQHLNDLWKSRNKEANTAVKAAAENWEKGGKKGPEPNAEKIRAKIMKGLGRPAKVDRSPHQSAFALDMNWRELGEMGKKDKKDYQGMMKKILEKEGFHQLNPLPKDELQHFEQDPTKSGYKTKDAAVQENKASFKAFEELGVAKDKYEK